MGEASPMFIPTFNHSLHIAARPDRLSADGGGVLLREVLEQSGIIEWLMAHLVDTRAQDQILRSPLILSQRTQCVSLAGMKREGKCSDAV